MSNPWNRRQREQEREYQRQLEAENHQRRISMVYQVPEHAAEEYVKLEDKFGECGAQIIAEFVKAMIGEKP